jgi:23S rRNA pseudouridine2605 synthase
MRLQKFLAHANVASRRKAEELIRNKLVTINGAIASIGNSVNPSQDAIKVAGKRVFYQPGEDYFLLNKPQKVICTASDPEERSTIYDLTGLSSKKYFSVGRLDYQSEGALIITNNGELCHALTHPKFNVPKVYRVKVRGKITKARLEKLSKGVPLEDGRSLPAKVELIRAGEEGGWLRVIITEGRNRQVRRMLEKVKLRVSRLKREAFAGLKVKNLSPGQLRRLTAKEVKTLKRWLN